MGRVVRVMGVRGDGGYGGFWEEEVGGGGVMQRY